MKTKENHYDIQKKNFYSNVKKRADEVQEVLDHAKESTGYCDFDTWYTQEYEWRFLKDILGTNKCFGTQFDYCGLIHLPKIKWTDSEDTEHIHTLIGTHTPGYYGFLTPGNVISSNDTINVSIIEPDESCTEEDDRKISLSVNMDNVQSALKNETGYAANTYLKVVNNGTTEEPDLGLEWVNLGGMVQENLLQWDDTTKEIFKGTEGNYTIIDDIKFKGAEKTVSELIDSKSEVEVSTQKVSGAADIYSINVDGTDYNLAGEGSGTPDAYLKSANVDGNKLTLTKKDDTTVEYTPSIPTKTSELTNDSGFITNGVGDLINYYTKSETYSQSEIDQKIATGTGLYLGWLENDAEELPSESEIGTWIINNWSSLQPSAVEQVTNNDYIFIYFSTQYVYWRVKVVTEATGKVLPSAVTWKKDLEFNDDIIGLVNQVKQNTQNITTLQTNKLDKVSDAAKVYCTSGTGEQTTISYGISASASTIPVRTATGALNVGTPTEDTNATTKKYVDDLVGNVETILQTNIDNEATRVNNKYTYSTTAPTAAATDGGIHIVVLDSEPTTKYDGYIYMIKE